MGLRVSPLELKQLLGSWSCSAECACSWEWRSSLNSAFPKALRTPILRLFGP